MATPPARSPATARTPEVAAGATGRSELGDTLRRAREHRGLSLEQVSHATKISPQHLEALERGIFINVPSGFYQRAQIRTYARAVSLDPDVALAQLDRPSASPVIEQPAPETPEPGRAAPWRKRALVAVVVILAAVALGRAMGEWEPAGDRNPALGASRQTPQQETAVGRLIGEVAETSARRQLNEAPAAPVDQAAPTDPAASPAQDAPRTAPSADLALASGTSPIDDAARTSNSSAAGGTSSAVGTALAPGGPPVVAPSRVARAPAAADRPPRAAGTVRAAGTAQTAVVAPSARSVAKPLAEAPKREEKLPPAQDEVRAAAPPVAGLVVITVPAGARVTVNGIAWGVTPLTIRYLPTGDKRIRVSKDGYDAEERAVRLSEGRSTTVAFQLHSKP